VPPILKFFVNGCCFAEMLGVFGAALGIVVFLCIGLLYSE
jgi:hypothetical protein